MSSTRYVNFSVRQNKTIERLIAFSGIQAVLRELGIADPVFVGLGSVWFSDFLLAHRDLGLSTLISVEQDPQVYARAKFNKPFSSIAVEHGSTEAVIPRLAADPRLSARPWLVWLDFDSTLSEAMVAEIENLVRILPASSVVLFTVSAAPRGLGNSPGQRFARLKELLGAAVEGTATSGDMKDESFVMNLMADSLLKHLAAVASDLGRPGGFVPAWRIPYQDGTPMVTVGGVLPRPGARSQARALVSAKSWEGLQPVPIIVPPLTEKETTALRALLPRRTRLTSASVRKLGFELDDEQVESFERHYLRYPTFAQLMR